MNLKILATADIHFERLSQDVEDRDNYINYFTSLINHITPDLFILAGDITDSRNLRAESLEYKNLTKFITAIYKESERQNTQVVVIQGTPSHEGSVIKNMIDIFNLDIMYFDKPKMYSIKNTNILMLPELYLSKYEELYTILDEVVKPVGKADLCFFHGMFDFAIPALRQIDSQFNMARSIVIKSKEFMSKYVKLKAFGGHVHKCINENNVYYLSRFINEPTQPKDDDIFGVKLLEVSKNECKQRNIPNPFIIDNEFVNIRINANTDKYSIIKESLDYNRHCTVFKVTLDNNFESRNIFTEWKNEIRPIYLKRKIVNKINDREEILKTSKTLISSEDIDTVISTLYKGITDKDLADEHYKVLKGEKEEN